MFRQRRGQIDGWVDGLTEWKVTDEEHYHVFQSHCSHAAINKSMIDHRRTIEAEQKSVVSLYRCCRNWSQPTGNENGEVSEESWPWFTIMDHALGQKHSFVPLVLICVLVYGSSAASGTHRAGRKRNRMDLAELFEEAVREIFMKFAKTYHVLILEMIVMKTPGEEMDGWRSVLKDG